MSGLDVNPEVGVIQLRGTAVQSGLAARPPGPLVSAILMPLGPICVGVLRFLILPGPVGANVVADPGRQMVILWLGAIAMLTLVPGVYAALHVLRPKSPTLSGWIAALLIPGYLGMSALIALDTAALAGSELGLSGQQITELVDVMANVPSMTVLTVIFIAGHIIGTTLLGIAAYRTRLMPRPIAVLLAISQFIHLAAVIAELPWLDLIAWSLTALGMAFIAQRLWRTSSPNIV